MNRLHFLTLAAALWILPSSALAWGNTGHRILGIAAMRALPAEVPAFLRQPGAAADVGELSREPDRLKGGGKAYDSDHRPAHFLDLDDDGRILGGPALASLPPTREDYDASLRVAGSDSWKAGYLPYAIVETYELLARDFAYWRALQAAENNRAWQEHHDWFARERRRREALILGSLGKLSHFVGDGSQPLHVTVHFNGWGNYPNPAGYSNARLHEPFESDLVRRSVRLEDVATKVAPFRSCGCSIEQRTAMYLAATARRLVPFYEMEKSGGLAPGDSRGPEFAIQQLSIGASELRDLVVEAWRASERESVGWKPLPVADVEAGRTDPYAALYGVD